MASLRDAPVLKGTVCLICGDKGETKLLIYCRKCGDSAVHHYCMDDVSPDDDNIYWVCWDCAPEHKEKRSIPEIPNQFEEPVNDPTTSWSHHDVHHMSGDKVAKDPRNPTKGKNLYIRPHVDTSNYLGELQNGGSLIVSERNQSQQSLQCDRIDDEIVVRAFQTSPYVAGQFRGSSDPSGHRGDSNSLFPLLKELDDREYDYQGKHEAGDEDTYIDEAPQLVSQPRSSNDSWMLKEPAPGGPLEVNVIPSFGGHIALDIWNGVERQILKCHLRNGALMAWSGPTKDEATQLVNVSGLGHLRECMFSQLNSTLLSAFVERWQPDTNTFHMPFGEMTITLHDVHFILGLPIDGLFVNTTTKKEDLVYTASELLGFDVNNFYASWPTGGPKLDAIRVCCSNEATPAEVQARGYITYLLGSTLFIDKTGTKVKPLFIECFNDFENIPQYSWGAATLAYLYRQLGRASRAKSAQLGGCLTLLEAWIYEHFPRFRPVKCNDRWRLGQSRAMRWKYTNQLAPRTPKQLRRYRMFLDELTVHDVVWMPYGPGVVKHVPKTLYHGCIRYMSIVEPYMPDRVLRQFGFIQRIPTSPLQPIKAKRPVVALSYKVEYPALESQWNMQAVHELQLHHYGTRAMPSYEAYDDYLCWYLKISHPRIQNPARVHDMPHDEKPAPDLIAIATNAAQLLEPLLVENREQLGDIEQVWTIIDACEGFVRLFTGSPAVIEDRECTGNGGSRRVSGG